jgi:CubicO group peptidase (beta-lactamase class C family)
MTPFLCRLLAVTALLGFGLALAVSAAGSPALAQAPDLAAIDAYIEEEMGKARIPGLALAIVRGEEPLHVRGYGARIWRGHPSRRRRRSSSAPTASRLRRSPCCSS